MLPCFPTFLHIAEGRLRLGPFPWRPQQHGELLSMALAEPTPLVLPFQPRPGLPLLPCPVNQRTNPQAETTFESL